MSTIAVSLITAAIGAASIDVKAGQDLFDVLGKLKAGDQVTIHAGRYKVPGYVALELLGTKDNPIVIAGKPGDEVIVEGISSQNTFNLSGSWFSLQGLKIEGGSHGVRLGTCDHVTLQDLEISGVGDVGISCNFGGKTCEAITIRRNHIHHTGVSGGPGECMYLGCNNNACQVWDSVIEYNWCHDTTAGGQGDGIELKTGSYNNIVRHNVIHDVKYPAITVYGTVNNKKPNIVEGNVIWAVQDNGIQMVGDATVQNNIIFDVGNYGLQIKPSQGELVENLIVQHNTVINPGSTCLRASDLSQGSNNEISNNALFCNGGTAMKIVGGPGTTKFETNAGEGATEGLTKGFVSVGDAAEAMIDPAKKNVYPSKASKLLKAGSPSQVKLDFNCRPRSASSIDIGAYQYGPEQNPGWVLAPGFKECEQESSTGTDGSTGTTATGSASSTESDESGTGGETKDDTTANNEATTTTREDETNTLGSEDHSTAAGNKEQQGNSDNADGCGCTSQQPQLIWFLSTLFLLPLLSIRKRRCATRT